MHIYFILTRKVEMLHKTTSTIFNSFYFSICVHSTNTTFSLLMNKEGLKGKGTVNFPLSLSFYAIMFSVIGWLVEGSIEVKKGCDRVVGHLCFLECHSFLFAFEASCSSKGKCDLSDPSEPLFA